MQRFSRTAERYTANLPEEDLEVLGYREWITALERGIAAHHAGLLPSFKNAIEDLFQRGLVKAVFATETLALGINMPARTVVLEKLTKWNGEAHVPITPGEYTQLTGRAGRRGIDIEGNAVVQWSPTVDSAMAASLASTRTYPLEIFIYSDLQHGDKSHRTFRSRESPRKFGIFICTVPSRPRCSWFGQAN